MKIRAMNVKHKSFDRDGMMGQNICERCGKPLSNFVSVKLGIGPVCRGKGQAQMKLPFEDHAGYKVMTVNQKFIYLEDTGHNQFKTVTNDAGYVLAALNEEYGIGGKRIFYKDSFGEIDEMLHQNGVLTGFRHGHSGYTLDMVFGKAPLPKAAKKKPRSRDDDFGM
jgi:hypothetical protein